MSGVLDSLDSSTWQQLSSKRAGRESHTQGASEGGQNLLYCIHRSDIPQCCLICFYLLEASDLRVGLTPGYEYQKIFWDHWEPS